MSSDRHRIPGHGQQPAADPQVRWWALLTGVVLIAVTVVAVRELIIVWNLGSLPWGPWIAQLPGYLTSRSAEWVAIAGVIAVLVGAIFVISAVMPRKKRYLRLTTSESSVWARPVDLARFSTAAAKRIPGVLAASSLGHRGRVTVTAAVYTPDDTADRDRILEALRQDVHAAFGEHIDLRLLLREATADDGATAPQPGSIAPPAMTTVVVEDDYSDTGDTGQGNEPETPKAQDQPTTFKGVSDADTGRMPKVTVTRESRRDREEKS